MSEKTIGRTFGDFFSEIKWLLAILFLLLLGVLWYGIRSGYQIKYEKFSIGKDGNETNEFSPDPLGIAGDWKYTVTPIDDEKLIGIDTVNDTLVEIYDKYVGTFTINQIQPNSTCYTMPPGKRTYAYIGNTPVDNTDKKLYFSQIYYSKQASKDAYSFKFDVSIIPSPSSNPNQGFVEVPVIVKDSSNKVESMTGKIYYLYQKKEKNSDKNGLKNQIWQLVKIDFSRN